MQLVKQLKGIGLQKVHICVVNSSTWMVIGLGTLLGWHDHPLNSTEVCNLSPLVPAYQSHKMVLCESNRNLSVAGKHAVYSNTFSC